MVRRGGLLIPGVPAPTGPKKTPGQVLAEKEAEEARKEEEKANCRSLWRGRLGSPTARSSTYGDSASLAEYDRLGCDNVKWRGGRRKSRKLSNKFSRCVKSVRKTVRARKGSTQESAAIAICTKSVLQTRGKTLKRYQKGRLVTQKKFRGGCGPDTGCL